MAPRASIAAPRPKPAPGPGVAATAPPPAVSDEVPSASKALHTSPVALCVELAGALLALSPPRPALPDSGDVELDDADPALSLELLPALDADPLLDVSLCEAALLEDGPLEAAPLPLELLCVLPELLGVLPELRCVLPVLCCVLPELCGCVAAELLWAGCQAPLCTGVGLLAATGAGAGAGADPPLGEAEAEPVPLPLVAAGSAAGATGGLQP